MLKNGRPNPGQPAHPLVGRTWRLDTYPLAFTVVRVQGNLAEVLTPALPEHAGRHNWVPLDMLEQVRQRGGLIELVTSKCFPTESR